MLLAWLCAVLPGLATAAPPGVITVTLPSAHPLALSRGAEVLIDRTGQLTARQAWASPDWQRGENLRDLPADPSRVWFRWRVRALTPTEAVLELPGSVQAQVMLHVGEGTSSSWSAMVAGDSVPSAQWPVQAPRVAFPVTLGPDTRLMLQVSHRDPFAVRPLLWSQSAYESQRSQGLLWMGLFLGVVAMALAYALGEALLRGDAVNGWYALHVLLMAVFQMVSTGFARMYLTDNDAELSQAARLIVGTLLAAASLMFARRLLPRAFGGSRADAWALVVAAFGVLLTAAYVVWPGVAGVAQVSAAQQGYYLLVLLTVALLLWAVRGVRLPYIGWYAAAFAAAAAGLAVEAAADRGWLGGWRFDGHAALAGAALEIVVMTYALNFSARDMMHDPGSRREGARLDRWTGLLHGGELPGVLMSLSVRALRMNTLGAVVLLRLANLDDLQRAHGSAITESVMKACARVLREACSPADVPMRLDDARFVVVLEQIQSHSEAEALTQRMLDLGLQHHPELPALEQLHLHAAIAYVPQDLKGRPQALLDRLDQAVQQIRRGSGSLIRHL